MLMPRRLGGSFGATNGLFRVLLCRQGAQFCGAHWTANDSHTLSRDWNTRAAHEAICASGALNGVPV
jgi:hypothetical protein